MVGEYKYQQACEVCLREMFFRVGEKYPNKELTDQSNWYEKHSWTQKDEEKFKQWMISYFRKKLRFTKKRAESEVSMFLLNYSWTWKFPLYMRVIKHED